ncbi:MAG TPA: NAD(P)-dependent alcohol dehydrogenase [Devosiaceae bacterium]|nr:NAD(P)-dependent alcohol dehydrogenase [Devosiaceae bacterium]
MIGAEDTATGAAMRAVLCGRYGPPEVLECRRIAKPVPKDKEILIRVRAATVTAGDCELRGFKFPAWLWLPIRLAFGVTRPRQPVLGLEVSGDIVSVGSRVQKFSAGDRVFGSTSFRLGAHADYVCLPATAPLAKIPAGLDHAQAAGIPTGGLNGLHFVRKAGIRAGERVLVNGAGGSIGMFTVQLAKLAGAEVTGVDRGDKLAMLRAIGADYVIDYQRQDFAAQGERYDVIIDLVGTRSLDAEVGALTAQGRLFLGNPRLLQMLRGAWISRRNGKRVLSSMAGERVEDLEYIADLVAAGTIEVVIDRTYPLKQMVAAHHYVEAGHKKGVVGISFAQDD